VDYPQQTHLRDREDWQTLIRWIDAQNTRNAWWVEEPAVEGAATLPTG
jgi:hypothetical protein